MSKSLDRRFEHYEQILTDLLGPIDNWPADELSQFLADAGIDMSAAERGLYERIDALAGTYRARNTNVPKHLQECLQQIRPADVPTSDPAVTQSVAESWVARMLKGQLTPAVPAMSHSFRGRKGELDPEDRALLDRLETRLRNRQREGE